MGKRQPRLPRDLQVARQQIIRHPDCLSKPPKKAVMKSQGDGYAISVEWQVELSYKRASKGKSAKGVRSKEPVTFIFPSTYPHHAPIIRLRDDFPRSFPHIQPRASGKVEPCVAYEAIDETFHREGLAGLLVRLSDWLSRAGRDELMDEAHGWEPTIRNEAPSTITTNRSILLPLMSSSEKPLFELQVAEPLQSGSSDSGVRIQFTPPDNEQTPVEHINPSDVIVREYISLAPVIYLPWPETAPSREFLNGSIKTAEDIISEAKRIGKDEQLKSTLRELATKLADLQFVPVGLVMSVLRPVPLLGSKSHIELIPFVLEFNPASAAKDDWSFPAVAASLRDAVTPELLRRFSGGQSESQERDLKVLGTGSLGSKIAMHEARRGAGPAHVFDNRVFNEHNAARHTLLPRRLIGDTKDPNVARLGQPAKAHAVAAQIKALGGTTKASVNAIEQILQSTDRDEILGGDDDIVLNTTASRSVRNALCAVPQSDTKAIFAEAFLVDGGANAGLLIEGSLRNPNLAELFALWMQRLREEAIPTSDERETRWIETGQGCGSATVTATDAAISAVAATIADEVAELRRTANLSEKLGTVAFGTREGMSLRWQNTKSDVFRRLEIPGAINWRVSISKAAETKIIDSLNLYPTIETGGYLVGHLSPIGRRFIVTDIIDAPSGSKRSAGGFDLAPLPNDYKISGNRGEYFRILGTWHSHLGSAKPSAKDRSSASEVASGSFDPDLLLITNGKDWDGVATYDN